MTYPILPETAQLITNITNCSLDPNAVTLHFEDGKQEAFLPWFVQKHNPAIGKFLVKDREGFTHVVESV